MILRYLHSSRANAERFLILGQHDIVQLPQDRFATFGQVLCCVSNLNLCLAAWCFSWSQTGDCRCAFMWCDADSRMKFSLLILQAKDRKRAAQLLELESGPFSVM